MHSVTVHHAGVPALAGVRQPTGARRRAAGEVPVAHVGHVANSGSQAAEAAHMTALMLQQPKLLPCISGFACHLHHKAQKGPSVLNTFIGCRHYLASSSL